MFGRYWCTLQALASILFTILFSVISNRTVRILPADPSVLFLLVECTTKTLLCATRHHQESRTNQKRSNKWEHTQPMLPWAHPGQHNHISDSHWRKPIWWLWRTLPRAPQHLTKLGPLGRWPLPPGQPCWRGSAATAALPPVLLLTGLLCDANRLQGEHGSASRSTWPAPRLGANGHAGAPWLSWASKHGRCYCREKVSIFNFILI